jgi:hypothetical protein
MRMEISVVPSQEDVPAGRRRIGLQKTQDQSGEGQ